MVHIIVSLLLVIASLGGSIGTLYAAQDNLPGQVLYPLKIWSEDIRIALTVDPSLQVELLLDMAQRRVEEMVALAQAGQTPPETVFQRMEQHLSQAMEQASGQEDRQLARTMIRVEERLRAMEQLLSNVPRSQIQEPVRIQLENWQRLARIGESDPAQFRRWIREGPRPAWQTPPLPTAGPTETPHPTMTPRPTEMPEPTETPYPSMTPRPTEMPEPTETPHPRMTPYPSETPEPTETPHPRMTPHRG